MASYSVQPVVETSTADDSIVNAGEPVARSESLDGPLKIELVAVMGDSSSAALSASKITPRNSSSELPTASSNGLANSPQQQQRNSFRNCNGGGGPHSQKNNFYTHNHGGSPHSHKNSFYAHNHGGSPHSHTNSFYAHNHGGSPHSHKNSFYAHNHGGSPHSHKNSFYTHNHGDRRDQYRGNQSQQTHRYHHGQWQRGGWGNPRHPTPIPPNAPVFFWPPIRPHGYGGPMAPSPPQDFVPPMVHYNPPPPEAFGGIHGPTSLAPPQWPRLPPPQARPFPAQNYELHRKIVNQIEYYFSDENLIKDIYLRKHMDAGGWVPISLIAGFRRMTRLTNDTSLILFALRSSSTVEVWGDKIRKRNNWLKWILPFPILNGLSDQILKKSSSNG